MTFREFLERYGPTVAVVAAVALVVMLLPGNKTDQPGNRGETVAVEDTDGELAGGTEGIGIGEGGGATGTGVAPTGATGVAGPTGAARTAVGAATGKAGASAGAGSQLVFGQGPNCRVDGRQLGLSKYSPPCVLWSGDNGGATFRGVTKDKVHVVRYVGPIDPATRAILTGAKLADDAAVVKRAFEATFRYLNQHLETYGREVYFTDFHAGGALENDEAMKADAVTIARDIKPFAVVDGEPAGPVPPILAKELSQRGIICMCTTSLSAGFYREAAGLVWSSLPTSTEYGIHIAEYIGKRVAGRKAKWAGDELNLTQGYRDKERKFGLIYIEGSRGKVDPELRRMRDSLVHELAKYGVGFAVERGFTYDPGRNQQDMTNMIAAMRGAGVTTVLGIWDPLSPAIITQEASRQQYYPEWFITGWALSDTTTGGRLYDQNQWRHAFGVSPLWVTWADVKKSGGYRIFHHGMPGMQPGDEGVLINIYVARPSHLVLGIHMAGPNLTNESWIQGQLRYPRTGGTPGHPSCT